MEQARDFSTISPSARALLLLKGLTDIPFARQAAALMSLPQTYTPDYSDRRPGFWARVLHFENRYKSIDQLLLGIPIHNNLELSSGFSFRGLAMTRRRMDVHYVDTDLPDIIATKTRFIREFTKEKEDKPYGVLDLLPLNCLDERAFEAAVDHLPPGEINIINEGLLMYLDRSEKEQLCRIIRKTLKRHGGYWITGDIYVRSRPEIPELDIDDSLKRFFDQHHIEQNKFESFEEAAYFFLRNGFHLDQEAGIDYPALSTMKYFRETASPELLAKMKEAGKFSAVWRLKLA